jgi:hypothetical protein
MTPALVDRGDLAAPHQSLDEQLGVPRAPLVAVEAELVRVLEVIEVEVLRALAVGAVQERAMRDGFRHANPR